MNAPLYNRIAAFANQQKIPFYMPGHKGRIAPSGFGSPLAAWDVTELPGTDSLYCPADVIAEAQELAADAFGAERSFFLVNGSSGGILAMLHYALCQNSRVLVDRTCHASVINGLVLTGAIPVFLTPEPHATLGVPGGITAASLTRAFQRYPETKAIILTYPTYYGFCCDLTALCKIAHAHGALVLVDEAHGAHLPFGQGLPPSALSCGADIVVQSMHKMLPAPNQSALLHCRGGLDFHRLKECINLFQTTSPSYPIMSYMDAARAVAQEHGQQWTQQLLERLRPIRPYEAAGAFPAYGIAARDPFKIILQSSGLSQRLHRHSIYPELCEGDNCLLLCSWHTSEADIAALLPLLENQTVSTPPASASAYIPEAISVPAMRPQEAFYAPARPIALADSIGKISKYSITAFPPCIPILLPGEPITRQKAAQITAMQKKGAAVSGLRNGQIMVVDC